MLVEVVEDREASLLPDIDLVVTGAEPASEPDCDPWRVLFEEVMTDRKKLDFLLVSGAARDGARQPFVSVLVVFRLLESKSLDSGVDIGVTDVDP